MNADQAAGIRAIIETQNRKIEELTTRLEQLEKALSEHAHYARNGTAFERTSATFAVDQYWDAQTGKVRTLP